MTELDEKFHGDNTGYAFYIPYFSVIRKDALTTKLRNVFNASAASESGLSLNDVIHPGPKLQTSIFDVIMQTRGYQYIFGADISKMFRQILLLPEDQNRIRILWRKERSQPVREFKLNTVTYGMDCAPWQSLRVIRQIAEH